MTREEAYRFLQGYADFVVTTHGVKIVDLDDYRGKVELEVTDQEGHTIRRWYNPWEAAKVIEAHS